MTGDYTQAPATALLATQCVACGRPLLDAASVEAALGPTCRERFGVPDGVSDEDRVEANALVARLATTAPTGTTILAICDRLRELGLAALADKVSDRTVAVRIFEDERGGRAGYLVASPYDEEAIARFRGVDGRRFVKEPEGGPPSAWWFPATSRNALWRALQDSYQGQLAVGPRGPFII